MKTVFIYGPLGWSVERVHRDVEKYLKDEFEFIYYDWRNTDFNTILSMSEKHDICMSNIETIRFFINNKININYKKWLFISHGSSEFQFLLPPDLNYGMTSYEISKFFPENTPVYLTRNGVEPSHFDYKERSGEIKTLGWCGSPGIASKRHAWSYEISNSVGIPLKRAETIPFSEMKEWYHTIDILIITAGPERYVETGPLPAFEAIVSGVLVIGTDIGNFSKIPGPKFSTIQEAVGIINDLKQNPEEVRRLAKKQYDCVIECWTYKDISIGWRTAFNGVLSRSSFQNGLV